MTRAYLGLLALDVLYLAAGLGLLAGFGLVRSAGTGLRLAGVAFTVGWAATGIVCTLLLVAGGSIGGVAGRRRLPRARRRRPARREPSGAGRRAPADPARRGEAARAAGAAVVVLYLEELGRRAFYAGATYHTDAWGFWLPKAKVIASLGGLDTGPGGFTSFFHPDYPPLVPVLDAVAFRFMGGLHASMLPLQEWIVAVGFVAAVAGLLARRVPAAVLWPCLALVVLSPSFGRWIGISLADLPLALLVALAAVAVAVWLDEGGGGHVALAATLLAAGALTKAEGASLAFAVALFAALASVRRLRTRAVGLVALFVIPPLALLPWRRWLAANDVRLSGDYHFRDLLDPGYLADRGDRLHSALTELPAFLVGRDDWLIVLPLALAAAVLVARRAPGLALLMAGLLLRARGPRGGVLDQRRPGRALHRHLGRANGAGADPPRRSPAAARDRPAARAGPARDRARGRGGRARTRARSCRPALASRRCRSAAGHGRPTSRRGPCERSTSRRAAPRSA